MAVLKVDVEGVRTLITEKEAMARVEHEAGDALRELADDHDRRATDLNAEARTLRTFLADRGLACPPPRPD